jgi:hypothetical protein
MVETAKGGFLVDEWFPVISMGNVGFLKGRQTTELSLLRVSCP